jgi:hypothetical protein
MRLGRAGAGAVGAVLALFGTLGPWLPALFISAVVARRRGRLEAIDALPFILLLVATIEILMASTARNGDMTKFRHRAGPLLVIVTLVWTLHFAAIAAATVVERSSLGWRRVGLTGLAVLSLSALGLSIGTMKRPRMRGAQQVSTARALLLNWRRWRRCWPSATGRSRVSRSRARDHLWIARTSW